MQKPSSCLRRWAHIRFVPAENRRDLSAERSKPSYDRDRCDLLGATPQSSEQSSAQPQAQGSWEEECTYRPQLRTLMFGEERRSRSATSYSWLRPLPFQDFSLASTLPLSTESCFSFAANLRSRTCKLKSRQVRSCWAVCSALPAQV